MTQSLLFIMFNFKTTSVFCINCFKRLQQINRIRCVVFSTTVKDKFSSEGYSLTVFWNSQLVLKVNKRVSEKFSFLVRHRADSWRKRAIVSWLHCPYHLFLLSRLYTIYRESMRIVLKSILSFRLNIRFEVLRTQQVCLKCLHLCMSLSLSLCGPRANAKAIPNRCR